jgi:hypothetical protein
MTQKELDALLGEAGLVKELTKHLVEWAVTVLS